MVLGGSLRHHHLKPCDMKRKSKVSLILFANSLYDMYPPVSAACVCSNHFPRKTNKPPQVISDQQVFHICESRSNQGKIIKYSTQKMIHDDFNPWDQIKLKGIKLWSYFDTKNNQRLRVNFKRGERGVLTLSHFFMSVFYVFVLRPTSGVTRVAGFCNDDDFCKTYFTSGDREGN